MPHIRIICADMNGYAGLLLDDCSDNLRINRNHIVRRRLRERLRRDDIGDPRMILHALLGAARHIAQALYMPKYT